MFGSVVRGRAVATMTGFLTLASVVAGCVPAAAPYTGEVPAGSWTR